MRRDTLGVMHIRAPGFCVRCILHSPSVVRTSLRSGSCRSSLFLFRSVEGGEVVGSLLAFERQPGAMELSVEKTGVEYKVRDMSQADFGRMELDLAEVEMPHGVQWRIAVEWRT
jgi:hypothetical protein